MIYYINKSVGPASQSCRLFAVDVAAFEALTGFDGFTRTACR